MTHMPDVQLGESDTHPLAGEYRQTLKMMQDITPIANSGDVEATKRLYLLTDRLTELSSEMSSGTAKKDYRRDDPLWEKWDATWKKLRQANLDNRFEEEETIWEELKNLSEKIEAREAFSVN